MAIVSANPVKYQLVKGVSHETCLKCGQLWEGECRAYEVPHSEAERQARLTDRNLRCCFGSVAHPMRRRIDYKIGEEI